MSLRASAPANLAWYIWYGYTTTLLHITGILTALCTATQNKNSAKRAWIRLSSTCKYHEGCKHTMRWDTVLPYEIVLEVVCLHHDERNIFLPTAPADLAGPPSEWIDLPKVYKS